MSEPLRSTSMLGSITTKLHTADALKSIGFYAIENDQWKSTLHCRIGNLPALSKEQHAALLAELNAALAPVTSRWAAKLCTAASDELVDYRANTALPPADGDAT